MMNHRVLLLVTLAFAAHGDFVHAAVSDATVDSLYHSLNYRVDCGLSYFDFVTKFDKVVPENERETVLSNLIQRAAKNPKDSPVVLNIMACLVPDTKKEDRPWSPELENALLAQALNSSPEVRQSLVRLLAEKNPVKFRQVILAGLKDENDRVREIVFDEIRKWPDSQAIATRYLEVTHDSHTHKTSLLRARMITNPEDVERCDKLSTKEPHSLQTLQKYIALHQNDPNYAVSVDFAQRTIKLIQDDLGFYRSQAEFAKTQDALKTDTAVIAKYGAVTSLELDDWGCNRGIKGVATYGEYGLYQFRIKGSVKEGTVRAAWHYQGYQYEITQIDEVSDKGELTNLFQKKSP